MWPFSSKKKKEIQMAEETSLPKFEELPEDVNSSTDEIVDTTDSTVESSVVITDEVEKEEGIEPEVLTTDVASEEEMIKSLPDSDEKEEKVSEPLDSTANIEAVPEDVTWLPTVEDVHYIHESVETIKNDVVNSAKTVEVQPDPTLFRKSVQVIGGKIQFFISPDGRLGYKCWPEV